MDLLESINYLELWSGGIIGHMQGAESDLIRVEMEKAEDSVICV